MTDAPIPFVAFVTDVLGVRLTPGQRVLAAVCFDGVEPAHLEGEDRDLARQLFGEVDQVPAAARGVVGVVAGARGGKSYILGGLYLLWRALTADLSMLAAGELASALAVAPDLRLGRQIVRYARGAAATVPSVERLVDGDDSDGFELARPDGRRVRIECLPATRGGSAVRGRSLAAAVLDECCFFRDRETGVVNDEDLYSAVAPRVIRGGHVVLASTPWIEAGLLFDLWRTDHGSPQTALVAHAPTLLLRDDDHTRLQVEREQARDPENSRREHGAQFLRSTAAAALDPEAVEAAFERAANKGYCGKWYLLLDASKGRTVTSDSMTAAICGWERKRPETVAKTITTPEGCQVAVTRPRLPGQHGNSFYETEEIPGVDHLAIRRIHGWDGDWRAQGLTHESIVAQLSPLCAAFGITCVIADDYESEGLRSAFSRVVRVHRYEAIHWSASTKAAGLATLQSLLRDGRIAFEEHPRLRAQLLALEQRLTPGGGVSVHAKRGGHDDYADLALGAAIALNHGLIAGAPFGRWKGASVAPYKNPLHDM